MEVPLFQALREVSKINGGQFIPLIILMILVTIGAVFWLLLWWVDFFEMKKEAHLSWWAISRIPIISRFYQVKAVVKGRELAKKGTDYAPGKMTDKEKAQKFKEFMLDLPLYQIEDSFFSSFIRGILEKGGARFQEVVLHDPSDIEDVYLHVRKDGNYFIHNKGLYHYPWENAKRVLHWDINDCRPLEDKAKDSEWINPEMNAKVVAGMVNTNTMAPRDEKEDNKLLVFILICVAVSALASLYLGYQMGQNQTEIMKTLVNISQNTHPAITQIK